MMRDRTLQIGLRVVLIVSLLGNGAALGAYYRYQSAVSERQADRVRMPQPIRQEYRRAVRNNRDLSQAMRALRQARRAVLTLVNADPIDRDALTDALAEVRRAADRVQEVGHPLVLEAILNHAENEGRVP